MNRLCPILLIFVCACSEYPSIVKVCVNYLEPNGDCGTGFFVAKNELITAQHITDESENHTLTLIGPGVNKTMRHFYQYPGLDMVLARGEVESEIVPLCDYAIDKTSVDLVRRSKRFGDLDVVHGQIHYMTRDYIYIDGKIELGFSGGPVIDTNQRCVIGMIEGTKNNAHKHVVAIKVTKERFATWKLN